MRYTLFKSLLIAVALVLSSACAEVQHPQKPEVIAYQVPLEAFSMLPAVASVPRVGAQFYTGMNANPEVVLKNASTTQMSATKISPFTALDAAQRDAHYIQVITVINLDTAGAICLYRETWAQDCTSAVAFTCLGATLQGAVTPAGTSREFHFDGTGQVCAVASEAAVDGQLARTMLYAQ